MGFERVTLGRTGLSVNPIGIASSYGTNEAMVEEAVDRGVNYLYWGALRTKKMARGIRSAVRRNRDDLVIVAHTTTRSPTTLSKVVQKSLGQLGVDHIDVLLLGWHNKKPDARLIDRVAKLKEDGLIRFSALSGHERHLFPDLEKDKLIDIFHVRYNAAHRGAEKEILDHLPEQDGPGVVSFTNTRWGSLLKPANMPPGETRSVSRRLLSIRTGPSEGSRGRVRAEQHGAAEGRPGGAGAGTHERRGARSHAQDRGPRLQERQPHEGATLWNDDDSLAVVNGNETG